MGKRGMPHMGEMGHLGRFHSAKVDPWLHASPRVTRAPILGEHRLRHVPSGHRASHPPVRRCSSKKEETQLKKTLTNKTKRNRNKGNTSTGHKHITHTQREIHRKTNTRTHTQIKHRSRKCIGIPVRVPVRVPIREGLCNIDPVTQTVYMSLPLYMSLA